MLKRRITAALLALCLAASVCVTGVGAVSTDRAVEATRTLGILPKSAELNNRVTRAQLAVMLTAASVYKDSVGTGGGISLFKDVKKGHWASEYIKLAVQQGWMSGYVDGTFRPEQNVTLEEACASLLIVLGYDASSLVGSYPYAQLTKAASVGLRDDLSAGQGQALTVRDCAILFYNLLISKNNSGTVYGTTLGYTVTNGQIDYSTLVNSDTKGPYVAEQNGTVTVPFVTENAVVYRDGVQSTLSAIQKYDVYYYNANMETIWAYSKQISGALTAVSPNTAAPTSVTVAGTAYSLGTSDAVYKCSSQGSFPVGSLVTLLLDKDGAVADVVSVSDTNGQIDYLTLVNNGTEGPYVAEQNGKVTVPFSTGKAVVYRNGVQSTLSAIQKYDVYYYNTSMEAIWAYSKRISGTLTAVSPNTAAPTIVTVAGTAYSLGTSDAVYKCSSQGIFSVGSLVTLLLDKDGAVADVVSVSEAEGIYYGVVTSSKKTVSTSSTSNSTASVQSQTEVVCTDGVTRTFYTSAGPYSIGRMVSVTVNGSGTAIKNIQSKRLSGTVNRDGTSLAGFRFAENIEILDTDSEGGCARIYSGRLAGTTLKEENVIGYTLNQEGNIDHLFLRNATGDTYKYVYITGAEKQSEGMDVSSSYSYIQNGQSQSYQSNNSIFPVDVGGARLIYSGDTIKSMKQLNSVNLSSLGSLDAMGDGKKYLLDENVQVILASGGYYPTTLSEINAEDYHLTGWYDNLHCPAGGRIRIIIAVPKT